MNRLLASFVMVLQFASGTVAQSEVPDAEAKLDVRVHEFLKEVRCLVCQNETLADSRAELAVDLRREVREQMKAGKGDEEVKVFLTERYGDFVLYRPPFKLITYPLWLGPFILLAGGFVALYRSVKGWSRSSGVRRLSPGERLRVRRLLDASEGGAKG